MTSLIDKAFNYANRVVEGKEITTKEVIIQCQWFLRDIKRQDNDDFEFYFDEKAVKKVEKLLKLMNFATGLGVTNKTILEGMVDFQAFFIVNVFGWRYKNRPDKFRYRTNYLFIPRKNAKTFICALVLIILMLTEPQFSQFYSICLDRELASKVKEAIDQILVASPQMSKHFKSSKTLSGKIECKITNSFYQARTAEANRNNSILPSAFIADEVGAFKNYANINAMKSGQLNIENPLMFLITTAYAEDQSIMLDELDYLKKIYNGSSDNERLFALLYYAEEEHLWDDYGIEQANPLRIESNYQEIRNSRKDAIEKPKEREEYLCKHMNHFLPSNSGETYINVDDVRKCKIDTYDWTDKEVYLGIDLSLSDDNTSFSFATYDNGTIVAESFAFIPEGKLKDKISKERIDYNQFIKEGKCFACGDLIIDYGFVEDMILQVEEKYKVKIVGVGYDRFNAMSTVQRLQRESDFKVVEVKQLQSILHMPTKFLREKILKKEFAYISNTLLEINFQNAKVKYAGENLNMMIGKKVSTGKIDMVASLINAIYLMQLDIDFNNEDEFVFQFL